MRTVNIGRFLSIGGQITNLCEEIDNLNNEIETFVNDISDRHQRAVKKLFMNKATFDSINKNGWVFKNHFTYINERVPRTCRSSQNYVQHIPIKICDEFEDGRVDMKW